MGQHRNREEITKGAAALNSISNSPNQPSNFWFPKNGFGKQSPALFKASGLGTIHGYTMTKRNILRLTIFA